MAPISRNVPADANAVVEVVVMRLVVLAVILGVLGIGGSHRLHHTRLGIGEHAKVVLAEVARAGVCHLKRHGEIQQTIVAEVKVTCLNMEGRAATHSVVAILVVAFHHVRRVEHRFLEIRSDAVAEIADTSLNKKTTIGVGAEREKLTHLGLDEETPLVDGKLCHAAATTNDFTIHRGDALSKNRDTVAFDLVAKEEVGIGRKHPIGGRLVDEAAAQIVRDAIKVSRVKGWQLKRIGHLKHGDGDGVLRDVFRRLCRNLAHNTQQKKR